MVVIQKGGVSTQNVLAGRSVYMRIRVLGDWDSGNIALIKRLPEVWYMGRSDLNFCNYANAYLFNYSSYDLIILMFLGLISTF